MLSVCSSPALSQEDRAILQQNLDYASQLGVQVEVLNDSKHDGCNSEVRASKRHHSNLYRGEICAKENGLGFGATQLNV